MCNPTLAISALSAGLQYQQAITQQKYQEQAAKRQNEIALANLEYRRKSSSLKLRQSTEKNLAKLKEAEELTVQRRDLRGMHLKAEQDLESALLKKKEFRNSSRRIWQKNFG